MYPNNWHKEINEQDVENLHPGYKEITCLCGRVYPVAFGGYDPHTCNDPKCPLWPDKSKKD